MGIDIQLLREQCGRTLETTDLPGLGVRDEGKVRDSYVADDRRTIRIISLAGGQAAEPARIALPGAAVTELLAMTPKGAKRPALLVGLDTAKLAILR